MPQKIIKDALGELRSESARLENPQSRQRLDGLADSIEKSAAGAGEPHGLIEEIRGAIEQFEVEHPRITECLNRIMVALSNMGI